MRAFARLDMDEVAEPVRQPIGEKFLPLGVDRPHPFQVAGEMPVENLESRS